MDDDLLWDFFSGDPAKATGAVAAVEERSSGAITNFDTFVALRAVDRLRPERGGIFCQKIFGPVEDDRCACAATSGPAARGTTCPKCGVLCDRASLRDERWGHVEVAGVVHPQIYERESMDGVHAALGIDLYDVRRIAFGTKALRDRGSVENRWAAIHEEELADDDLIGPSGLAEALRRTAPEHPLLSLCAITKVPVPPPGRRPFAPREAPTQVDPWIGRVNEAWLGLVERGRRQLRLRELGAPDIILQGEDVAVQNAFASVVDATRLSARRLLPPLSFVPEGLEDADARGLAFVGHDRLVVQRRDHVSLVDLEGVERLRLPPCGARLRGVVANRYAVFEGIFQAAHPMMDVDGCGYGDEVFTDGEGRWFRGDAFLEASIVDCETGTYLSRPPPEVHLRFFRNDEPEDLFLEHDDREGRTRIHSSGDRPEIFAYAPGMLHGWVGSEGVEESTIVDTNHGRPQAYLAPVYYDDTVPRLALLDGADTDDEEDDEEVGDEAMSATALAFASGAWHVLGRDAVLRDHRARNRVKLVPTPEVAAFDPSGQTLAVIVQDNLVRIDVARRVIVDRRPIRRHP